MSTETKKQRTTVALRIYKGKEILFKADGVTPANENQLVKLTYGDLQWKSHLQNLLKGGLCKIEVEAVYVGEDKVATPDVIADEIKALLQVKEAELTDDQKRIKALEERFNQQIAPALQVTKQYAKNAHEAAILKVHSDAFDIYPNVEAWVNTQPNIVKSAYNAVLDKGTSAQIVELFNIFKSSTKATAPVEKQEVKEEKAAKEKKLNAQEGVRGRHTSGRAAVDPDDFDGAFDKFAATA